MLLAGLAQEAVSSPHALAELRDADLLQRLLLDVLHPVVLETALDRGQDVVEGPARQAGECFVDLTPYPALRAQQVDTQDQRFGCPVGGDQVPPTDAARVPRARLGGLREMLIQVIDDLSGQTLAPELAFAPEDKPVGLGPLALIELIGGHGRSREPFACDYCGLVRTGQENGNGLRIAERAIAVEIGKIARQAINGTSRTRLERKEKAAFGAFMEARLRDERDGPPGVLEDSAGRESPLRTQPPKMQGRRIVSRVLWA